MRAWLLLLLAGVSFGAFAESPRERFDFLGRVVSITKIPPDPCEPRDAVECIVMYEAWDARYVVLDTLAGRAPGREVTVRIITHYGFPAFARYRHAVVRTERYDDAYVVDIASPGFAVFGTRAGGWATCGDPLTLHVRAPSTRMHAIAYAEDLGDAGQFAPRGLATAFDGLEGHYDVVDGRVRCREGIALAEMYAMLTGTQPHDESAPPPVPASDWLPTEGRADDPRFIGRLVSAERVESPCEIAPHPGRVCAGEWTWDARFEVVASFDPRMTAHDITVRMAGWPTYASYRHALVVAAVRADGHLDATAVPVFRTRAGGWATCGDPLRPTEDAPSSQRMHRIDFADDLGAVGQLSEEGVRDAFLDFAGHYDIAGGRVRCREGIDVADALDLLAARAAASNAPK